MSLPHTFTGKDGRKAIIRRIQPNDTALLVDMWHHLSDETKRLRFHAHPKNLPDDELWKRAMALAKLDPARQVAVVAVIQDDDGEHAVGVARLSRATPSDTLAETAVVVRDDYQQIGLGTHLLHNLAEIARAMGITKFEAWVLAENRPVMEIIRRFGFPIGMDTRQGETHVVLDIDPH